MSLPQAFQHAKWREHNDTIGPVTSANSRTLSSAPLSFRGEENSRSTSRKRLDLAVGRFALPRPRLTRPRPSFRSKSGATANEPISSLRWGRRTPASQVRAEPPICWASARVRSLRELSRLELSASGTQKQYGQSRGALKSWRICDPKHNFARFVGRSGEHFVRGANVGERKHRTYSGTRRLTASVIPAILCRAHRPAATSCSGPAGQAANSDA